MNANIVKKSSLFPVLMMYLKEFTVERNRIHVSIVEKLSLVPMTIIVVKVSTLERIPLYVKNVGKPSNVWVIL